jgi:hypothetical protein
MNHANWVANGILLFCLGAVLRKILQARRGKPIYIRRIPGLASIDEAVGRSVELGRPILFNPGSYSLQDVPTLAALSVMGYVAQIVAKLAGRMIVVTCQPANVPICTETIQRAYDEVNRSEYFDPNDVRFLTTGADWVAMASAGIMQRERIAACFYFGGYGFESLLFSEAGNRAGCIQIAGTADIFQIPFFIASCDYVVIGEELFAASAYLSREPTMLGSLIGQDYGKILCILLYVVAILAATVGGTDNAFARLMQFSRYQ